MADFEGGDAAPRGPRRDRPRPAGRSCRTATATARGSTRKALELAGIDRDTPDPADGRIERDPDGSPDAARSTRGRRTSSSGCCPPTTDADARGGPAPGASATSTRSGSRPGRTRSSSRTPRSAPIVALASRGELTGRVVGALWWDRDARRRADRGARRAAARHRDRPLRADQREADDGRRPRELHRRDARAVSRRPTGGPTDEPRAQLRSIPDGARAWPSSGIDALGFQPHFHAIGDRAVRESLDAVAAARRGQRPVGHAAAHRPHPGDPPRRHPALRGARTSPPTRSRYWAVPRGPDGRPHDPVPRAGAVDAGSTRSGRCCAAGARAGDGLGLERLDREPAARDGGRGRARSRRRVARRAARPFLPDERLDLVDALAAFTLGLGLGQPPRRRDGLDRGRQARRPRGHRPRPVRAGRRARSATRGSSLTFIDGAVVFEDPALG